MKLTALGVNDKIASNTVEWTVLSVNGTSQSANNHEGCWVGNLVRRRCTYMRKLVLVGGPEMIDVSISLAFWWSENIVINSRWPKKQKRLYPGFYLWQESRIYNLLYSENHLMNLISSIIIYERGRKRRKSNIRYIQGIMSDIDWAAAASDKSWELPRCNFFWHHNHSMIDTYEWYLYI